MLESQWQRKNDEEIEAALKELDLYTPEAQRVISAEAYRRAHRTAVDTMLRDQITSWQERTLRPRSGDGTQNVREESGKSEATLERERAGLVLLCTILWIIPLFCVGMVLFLRRFERNPDEFIGELVFGLVVVLADAVNRRKLAGSIRKIVH
ncbi:MAG TPA: hypothetical protein VEZ90_13035, partial [Blastocatellia bacterium]|nr:hypothetical protein [Blastocatellia bacterium]